MFSNRSPNKYFRHLAENRRVLSVCLPRACLVLLLLSGIPLGEHEAVAQKASSAANADVQRSYCPARGEGPPPAESQATIEQGIYGRVTVLEGDFMPSPGSLAPDEPCPGLVITVRRPVLIYPAKKMEDVQPAYDHPVTGPSPFLTDVEGEPVKTVYSDYDGFFQVKLPPGRYSMLPVAAGKLYYAPGRSGNGVLEAVAVELGEAVEKSVDLDWSATD